MLPGELVIPFVCLYRQDVFAYERYNRGYLVEGKGNIVVPKSTGETIRTSVVLNKHLWSTFKGQIWDGLGVSELSAALDILIRRWLDGRSDRNSLNVPSTNGLEPVLSPGDPKGRYANPDLAVLQDATAKALEEQDSSELAKAIISLLRIYGSKDARFWAVSSSGEAQQPQGSGSQGNEPGGRIASIPATGSAKGRVKQVDKAQIG